MNVCWKKLLLTLLGLFSLTACNIEPNKVRAGSGGSRSSTLEPGHAFLMLQSPTDQDPTNSRLPLNIGNFISFESRLVTSKEYLAYDCKFNNMLSENCIKVLRSPDSPSPLVRQGESWSVDADSEDFLQVQTLYHAKEMIERFYSSFNYAINFHTRRRNNASSAPLSLAPATPISPTSIWLEESTAPNFSVSELEISVFCPEENGNPVIAYLPAKRRICLGSESWFQNSKFHFSQDPEAIYHELSHVLVEIMTNLRNSNIGIKTDLGFLDYDEALSINEGLADYMSYVMTGNSRLFEWSLGTALPALNFGSSARPTTESDTIHTSGISDDSASRLSYPQYITYNPNSPQDTQEDVHNTGQIISHYLVSLTKELQTTCSVDAKNAQDMVMTVIIETLAELGDLTGRGSDLNNNPSLFYTNFNNTLSYDWIKTTRTVSLQRFMQTFSKYNLHYIKGDICPSYSKDAIEKGLDKYGLLLFDDYQDNGLDSQGNNTIASSSSNLVQPSPLGVTPISILNRTKTTLISHSQISLPTNEETRPNVFLIDSIEGAQGLLKSHAFQGNPLDLTASSDLSGTRFNNDNRFFNPGEVVGFSLNLVNESNIPLAGVQILGNDWDHYKADPVSSSNAPKICSYDGFPGTSEGGIIDNEGSNQPGDCNYAARNSSDTIDSMQPVCFVQKVASDGSQKWITQNEFRNDPTLSLSESQCLGPQGDDKNPNECLARIVPGGDHTFFSKIDPGKTWAETIYGDQENQTLASSGFMIMEINKFVPAGTLFNCRFRVRFSNCSNCYSDTQSSPIKSYNDYEYNAQKPYKLINFQFRVLN